MIVSASQPPHVGYLLDTSVLSILAPGRVDPLPDGFGDWLRARAERLVIPCIAVAEVEQGICKLRRAGGVSRADRLTQWLDGLIAGYADHILPLDTETSRLAGRLSELAIAKGRHPGFPDVVIAALAQRANLLLLTRNLKHFTPLGVTCADPVVALPD